jgi:hypothetical protein
MTLGKYWDGSKIKDPKLQASSADVERVRIIHKFGAAESVGTTLVPVCDSKTWETPSAAQAIEIVSDDNVNDISTGAGARKVRVWGIRNWNTGEEQIDYTLTGTTAVAMGNWLRIYRLQVVESGTYATQTGSSHDSTITVRGSGGGSVWGIINHAATGMGAGQSQLGVWSAGANTEVYIEHLNIAVEASKNANIFLFVRENADVTSAPYGAMQLKQAIRVLDGITHVDFEYPLGPFYGPCDIGFMGHATPSGTADLSCRFTVIELDIS